MGKLTLELTERYLGSLRQRVAFRIAPHPLPLPPRAYSPSRLTPNAFRLVSVDMQHLERQRRSQVFRDRSSP
jgi:hypothetical protein